MNEATMAHVDMVLYYFLSCGAMGRMRFLSFEYLQVHERSILALCFFFTLIRRFGLALGRVVSLPCGR